MLASFSIVPIGVGEEVKEQVAEIIDMIDRSGLDYRVSAMSTTVEGDLDSVLTLVRACHLRMRELAPRVLTSVTIDDRADADGRLAGKVDDVEEVLGRDVSR